VKHPAADLITAPLARRHDPHDSYQKTKRHSPWPVLKHQQEARTMSNVIPFVAAGSVNFDAIPEIRRIPDVERGRRIRHRMRAIADAFPASLWVLGMHKLELVELLAKKRASNEIVPAEFLEDFTTAARHARAVTDMIEAARVRVAVALNLPVYALDDEDNGDDAA
jgi:hypothetical protein